MSDDPSREKRRLRAQLRAAWRALPRQELEVAAREVARALVRWPPWTRARTVALYWALGDELPTGPLVEEAVAAGKRVALPVVSPGGLMEFHAYLGPASLREGLYGIPEPDPSLCPRVDPAELDLVAVPALAFDTCGCRLGRGGGYYDRFLLRLRPDAVRVGLTLARFILPRLPATERDQRVHALACERGVVWVAPENGGS